MKIRQRIVSILHGTAKLLPHFRGKYRLFYLLYRVLLIPVDQDYYMVMRNTRTKVVGRLNSLIEREMICLGEYEPNETRVIENLVKPNWSCIDIGANVGFYTVRLAELVEPEGHVFSIEPYDTVHLRLVQNTKDIQNVTLLSCAVSDIQGEAPLITNNPSKSDNYNATLVHTKPSQSTKVVELKTLSNLWQAIFNLKPIHFIKIDIEGYEFKALVGGKELIQKCKPIILMEYNKFWAQSMGWSFQELLDWLRTLANYSAFSVGFKGVLQPLNDEPLKELSNVVLIACDQESMSCA